MAIRVTQVPAEVLGGVTGNEARTAAEAVEVGAIETRQARVSQAAAEVLGGVSGMEARLTAMAIEVARPRPTGQRRTMIVWMDWQ